MCTFWGKFANKNVPGREWVVKGEKLGFWGVIGENRGVWFLKTYTKLILNLYTFIVFSFLKISKLT